MTQRLKSTDQNVYVCLSQRSRYNGQGRNEVRWRPGQEASLAPHVRTWGFSEENLLQVKKVGYL